MRKTIVILGASICAALCLTAGQVPSYERDARATGSARGAPPAAPSDRVRPPAAKAHEVDRLHTARPAARARPAGRVAAVRQVIRDAKPASPGPGIGGPYRGARAMIGGPAGGRTSIAGRAGGAPGRHTR